MKVNILGLLSVALITISCGQGIRNVHQRNEEPSDEIENCDVTHTCEPRELKPHKEKKDIVLTSENIKNIFAQLHGQVSLLHSIDVATDRCLVSRNASFSDRLFAMYRLSRLLAQVDANFERRDLQAITAAIWDAKGNLRDQLPTEIRDFGVRVSD